VYDVPTGRRLVTAGSDPNGGYLPLAFRPDGRQLATLFPARPPGLPDQYPVPRWGGDTRAPVDRFHPPRAPRGRLAVLPGRTGGGWSSAGESSAGRDRSTSGTSVRSGRCWRSTPRPRAA